MISSSAIEKRKWNNNLNKEVFVFICEHRHANMCKEDAPQQFVLLSHGFEYLVAQ